jgi:purine-binding chemotaxis protein CheW
MRAQSPQAIRSVLIFRVAGYTCAIASHRAVELVLIPALIQAPGQPEILDGFLNLRGIMVPVVCVHRLFQREAPEPQLYTPLITIRTADGLLALRVDSAEEVAAVEDGALLPYGPEDSLNECAEAQFDWRGQAVALLSIERLLLAKERDCLAALRAQMQQRLADIEELLA